MFFYTCAMCVEVLHTPPLSSSLNITYRTLHQHTVHPKRPKETPGGYYPTTFRIVYSPVIFTSIPECTWVYRLSEECRQKIKISENDTNMSLRPKFLSCVYGAHYTRHIIPIVPCFQYCLSRNQYMLCRSEDKNGRALENGLCVPSQNNTHEVPMEVYILRSLTK